MSTGRSELVELEVADMAEAAFLMSCGADLVRLRQIDGRKYAFVLSGETEELAKGSKQFKTGKAMVEPLRYYNDLRKLRAALSREYDNTGG